MLKSLGIIGAVLCTVIGTAILVVYTKGLGIEDAVFVGTAGWALYHLVLEGVK